MSILEGSYNRYLFQWPREKCGPGTERPRTWDGTAADLGRNGRGPETQRSGPGTGKWPGEGMASQVPGKSEATEKPLGIPSKTTEIIANHL